jgi:hypothetical protein
MRARDGEEGAALRDAVRKLEAAAGSGELKSALENIQKVAQRKLDSAQAAAPMRM